MADELDLPPSVEAIIVDLPALRDQDADTPGVYVGLTATDPAAQFDGGSVLVSHDEGANWDELQSFRGETVVGRTVGILGGGVSGHFWDTLNTLRVILNKTDDSFASEADEDVVSGRKNMLLVGKEILGFATATAVAGEDRTYDLTRLCRGRRDTAEWIEGHVDGEQVVLLSTPSTLNFVPTGNNDLGQDLTFRGVSANQAVTDAAFETTRTLEGNNVQAFAPIVKPAVRDADGNIAIEWTPRSRRVARVLGLAKDFRLECCDCEQYEVDILTPDRLSILRTFTIINRRDFIYPVAMQVVDFGSAQSLVAIDIHQSTRMVGRGRVKPGVEI